MSYATRSNGVAPTNTAAPSNPTALPNASVNTTATVRPLSGTLEQQVVTLEWVITNLRAIFESTKGDTKSRCIKSPLFGQGKWQIYFYPCSGPEQFISLYLACEPTPEERARGMQQQQSQQILASSDSNSNAVPTVVQSGNGNGKENTVGQDSGTPWVREGLFKFTFELRSPDRQLFKIMEATDHAFSQSQRNWGWSQFQSRNSTFFNNPKAKSDDALVIVCSITYPPCPPQSTSIPIFPKRLIPNELIQAYASLFNDKEHSDVVFYIKSSQCKRTVKKLYAIKKILSKRSEYFQAMFDGWNEENSEWEVSDENQVGEFSDEEGESDIGEESQFHSEDENTTAFAEDSPQSDMTNNASFNAGLGQLLPEVTPDSNLQSFTPLVEEVEVLFPQGASHHSSTSSIADASAVTPLTSPLKSTCQSVSKQTKPATLSRLRHRRKAKVIITDASYKTFKALLHYLYTDTVFFLPLTSSYLSAKEAALSKKLPFPFINKKEWFLAAAGSMGANGMHGVEALVKADSQRPILMASAKEIYTIADKLNLTDLKERAASHIHRALTISTIPLEVFSPFTTKFPEMQIYQKDFLLKNWREVRKSPAMKAVFKAIGEEGSCAKFPGFVQVWSSILPALEYNAVEAASAASEVD